MKRSRAFEDFYPRGFWNDAEWAKKYSVEPKPRAPRTASIEEELGYVLPRSYVWLMTRHNGGTPARTCFPTKAATSWERKRFKGLCWAEEAAPWPWETETEVGSWSGTGSGARNS